MFSARSWAPAVVTGGLDQFGTTGPVCNPGGRQELVSGGGFTGVSASGEDTKA